MKIKILSLILLLSLMLTGCSILSQKPDNSDPDDGGIIPPNIGEMPTTPEDIPDIGGDDKTFGDDLDESGAYDGFFEEESLDFTLECEAGTKNAYTLDGNVLTFTAIAEDSVYSISGSFSGCIVINVGDDYKLDLELCGFSLVSSASNPITVISGSEVAIKAKKDTENYIYDIRAAVDSSAADVYSGAIHSEVDLELGGKGSLTVVSENNNGIHSKKDLQVQNLTLMVACLDNSLKGNDSVEITSGELTLIASVGDCIKTSDSDISEKGNQRGTITISGGTHTLYAACDGIDAAYNASIEGEDTKLTVYTDKYSNYSKEVTSNSEATFYVRYSSQKYSFSVKFINSETSEYKWVNAEYHSRVQGGRTTYYYYSFPKEIGYDKLKVFAYSSGTDQQQESQYAMASDVMTVSSSYDTIAISSSRFSWTNYTTSSQPGGGFGGAPGGPGGFGEGNKDKGDHSTKGIKAANEILISGGDITVKAYDDAIHANSDTALENGESPLGNVTVSGGTLALYSNDDGLHADGTLLISGGAVVVTNAYEGIEGTFVKISGGYVSVNSKDDGINATTQSGTAIEISGGTVYIYCTGDGIDSNSRASYSGIVFSGGRTVVISNSSMNSAIDSEQGYAYNGGYVIAIMPKGGMSSESQHCQNFSGIGRSQQLALTSGVYLVVNVGEETATVKMPVSLSALVIVLGDNSASISTRSSTDATLDSNGVSWN